MNRYGWLAAGTGLGLLVGIPAGFFSGVASTQFAQDLLKNTFSEEQPANVSETKTYNSKTVSFQYPGNWSLETKNPSYNPDYYIILKTPGGAWAAFNVVEGKADVKALVKDHADAYQHTIVGQSTFRPVTQWGSYSGYGMELKGMVMRQNPGLFLIFSHAGDARTFTVSHVIIDKHAGMVQPGFDLIRRTFRLK